MQHEQKSNEKRKKGFVAFKVCQNSTVLYLCGGVISLNRFMVTIIYIPMYLISVKFSRHACSTGVYDYIYNWIL